MPGEVICMGTETRNMNTCARTDVGRERDINEDSVFLTETETGVHVAAVADGMGGHQAGDIASQTAVDHLEQMVSEIGTESHQQWLQMVAHEAHDQLLKKAEEEPQIGNMGTTFVATAVSDDVATIINVGDSRAYHLTDVELQQVTIDHSLVQEMVNTGELTPEEAKNHPQRNIITQSLGGDNIDPDDYTVNIELGLLLCSDGLTEEVDDTEIEQILRKDSPVENRCEELISTANENGGSDNIGIVYLEP